MNCHNDDDSGFTLVELLLALTMSGIILGALFAVLLVTFRTTSGLSASAPAFGKQNSDVIGNQVVVNDDIQVLTKRFSADASNVVVASAVSIPGSLACARPATDPSLGTDQPVVRIDYRDNNNVLHQVNYRFSTDSFRHQGQIARYDCTSGTDIATVLTRGLDTSVTPTATTLCLAGGVPSPGLCATPVGYRLALTTLVGRKYNLYGSPRITSGSLAAVGAPSTSVTGPLPNGVTMTDGNHDGFIDTVLIQYAVDPPAACLPVTAWTAAFPPSGASLSAPFKPGGNAIALPFIVPTGPVDTAATNFTVSFTPPSGCTLDPFLTLAPIDQASPVLIGLQPVAGVVVDGKPDPGDGVKLTYSEPLDPATVPTKVRLVEQNTAGHDLLFLTAVAGGEDLTQVTGVNLNTNGTYIPMNSAASYLADVTTNVATAPTVLTVTIPSAAPCDSGDCTTFQANSGSSFVFSPGAGLHDASAQQNPVVTLSPQSLPVGIFRMY